MFTQPDGAGGGGGGEPGEKEELLPFPGSTFFPVFLQAFVLLWSAFTILSKLTQQLLSTTLDFSLSPFWSRLSKSSWKDDVSDGHRRDHKLIRYKHKQNCIRKRSNKAHRNLDDASKILTDSSSTFLHKIASGSLFWCVCLPHLCEHSLAVGEWTGWINGKIFPIRTLWRAKVLPQTLSRVSWWPSKLTIALTRHLWPSLLPVVQVCPEMLCFTPPPPPPLPPPIPKARLRCADGSFGKLFGNPNLSEIIWLQPPITCWFGGIRSALRSSDFHFVFEL